MSLIPPISEHAQPLVDVLFPKFDEIVECIYLQRAFSGSSPDITPNEYCQLNNLTLNSGMSFDELTDSIVKHCIAKLAVQPLIRKFARSFFRRHAVVTTSPLPGKQEISDPSHQYYQIHNLRAKPVSEFEESFRTQFLTIDRAAGEGFITVDISLPQGEDDAFLSKCLAPFLEDKGNMAWNDIVSRSSVFLIF
jgi:transcriptional accessory protein Tex/SPT6